MNAKGGAGSSRVCFFFLLVVRSVCVLRVDAADFALAAAAFASAASAPAAASASASAATSAAAFASAAAAAAAAASAAASAAAAASSSSFRALGAFDEADVGCDVVDERLRWLRYSLGVSLDGILCSVVRRV